METVVAVVGIVGTLGGLFIAWEQKKLAKLTLRVLKLEQEVRARILLEQTACDMLATRDSITPRAAMLRLREECFEANGVRPTMTPRDVD